MRSYPKEWEKRVTLKNELEVFLRPELSSDTDLLWEMFSTLSKTSVENLIPPFTRERIETWTSDIDYSKNLPIVALVREGEKERIICSATLSFYTQEIYRHKGEVGIAVHDDYQNLGLGTAMVQHVLKIAREKSLKKISLRVNADNNRAIRVYEKCGFKIEAKLEKERFQEGQFRDEYVMTIFL